LSYYLEQNNLLKDCQFGFRQNRSTEQATTLFTDKIKRKVNEGKLVGTVFIDLSKAFDTLSHAKIITKLQSYGVSSVELQWFQDYLFNRTQFVQFGDVLSQGESVRCGVPQGSIIGPLLFILFYNDFSSCLKHSEVIIYADDTVIIVPGKDITIIETRLSADMKRIYEWCLENELILNLSKGKTESMLFGTSQNLAKQTSVLNIKFAHENVLFTKSYKYLGVKITPSLNMNTNFDHAYKKASGRLRLLRKIRSHLTPVSCGLLYQSMITPILTYCATSHLKKTKSQLEKLESIHSRATDIISSEIISRKIKSPSEVIKIKALQSVRKCLDGSTCSNYNNYFQILSNRTRNNGILLKLPRLRLEYARGSFYYAGAVLYNELPCAIRTTQNFNKFKTMLV
jgi:hypothetical protein